MSDDLKNIAKEKSLLFSIRIVNLYKYLVNVKNENIISKQILKSGTSIGANIAESECAISLDDFTSKIYISLKECMETEYWLQLLKATDYIICKLVEASYLGEKLEKDYTELIKARRYARDMVNKLSKGDSK